MRQEYVPALHRGAGRNLRGDSASKRAPRSRPADGVGIVFQHHALLDWRNVHDNILLPIEFAGKPVASYAAKVDHLLKMTGLQEFAGSYPRELSGGMRQRAAICRALVDDPPLLLMDEPFGALDAMTRESLQDELARLVREQGLTVVFVTHDLEEALYLGDRVIALRSNPTLEKPSLAAVIDVPLPLPREQLATKEHPEFLRLRRELYQYLGHA